MSRKLIALLLAVFTLSFTFVACQNGGTPAATDEVTEAPATEAQTEAQPEDTTPAKPAGTPVKVILLSGQSNAVGYAYDNFNKRSPDYDEARVSKIRSGFSNVLIRFSNNALEDGANGVQFGKYENEEFEPVNFNQGCRSPYDNFQSIGPEVGLAEYLSEHYPDETFYIVKCATSGADLYNRFNPDNRVSRDNLFEQMVNFTTDVLKGLEDKGFAPEIIAFCWMQGESDSQGNAVSGYIGIFDNMIGELKKELARYMPDNGMAIVDAGIRAADVWTHYQELNDAKKAYAEKSNKRFYFDTYDISVGNDNIHYDNMGQLELGNRFGDGVGKALAVLGEEEVIN